MFYKNFNLIETKILQYGLSYINENKLRGKEMKTNNVNVSLKIVCLFYDVDSILRFFVFVSYFYNI